MPFHLTTYSIALAVFLVLDALWLSTVGRQLYLPDLKPILRSEPNFAIAGLFYALFVAGLVFFVIAPGISSKDIWGAAMTGAFFGLVAYATYDLTNLSTLKDFTVRVAVIDMLWGAGLSASVTIATLMITRWSGWE
jgi:uncharacterized membrane protein